MTVPDAARDDTADAAPLTRTWRPGRPVAVHTTWAPLRRGGGDPTYRTVDDGSLWRTHRTPTGPATLRVAGRPGHGEVEAQAWGPGAEWVLDQLPAALGGDDDDTGFVPGHPLLRDMALRHPGWRVPRTGLVLESLVPAVLEQKVTGTEARRAWRHLLVRYGEPAPGPTPTGMLVPPDAATWARVPSWEWHLAGVDAHRSRTSVQAARVAGRMEECVRMTSAEAVRRLTALPGVGPWTAAEVGQRALGDADAVSFGDIHMSKEVGYALTGSPLDDDDLREVLEQWAGHRYRVVRLCELSGVRRPRRAPRFAPNDFRRM